MKGSNEDQPNLFGAPPPPPAEGFLPPENPARGPATDTPLAHGQRPTTLEKFVGQKHFFTPRFRTMIESDRWSGLLFWGPPGTGKTTLANLIAAETKRPFRMLSAVRTGVKEMREVIDVSRADRMAGRKAHVLFLDEIHHLNKSQQDILLPAIEDGTIRFIGATTENPSFELNNAILSRSLVFRFQALPSPEIVTLLERATAGKAVDREVLERIAAASLGDARKALTLLDHLMLGTGADQPIAMDDWEEVREAQGIYYDKKSEMHYDTISAFIKSVRNSDPDAAVYYLARMLEGGEDPLFIARRLMILASEDIGNANPAALMLATSCFTATHAMGLPECRIPLSQTTVYLACSEKSNRSYVAINQAIDVVKATGTPEIPMWLRNAPTKAMKEWGYGQGYQYAHNAGDARTEMECLPKELAGRKFYEPSDRGTEARFREFLAKKPKGQR